MLRVVREAKVPVISVVVPVMYLNQENMTAWLKAGVLAVARRLGDQHHLGIVLGAMGVEPGGQLLGKDGGGDQGDRFDGPGDVGADEIAFNEVFRPASDANALRSPAGVGTEVPRNEVPSDDVVIALGQDAGCIGAGLAFIGYGEGPRDIGADEVLTKPIIMRELARAIRKVLD